MITSRAVEGHNAFAHSLAPLHSPLVPRATPLASPHTHTHPSLFPLPAPTSKVTLTVAVKHDEAGRATLTSELMERSDPDSPRFAQWMGRDDVDALLAPPAAAVEAVLAWLGGEGERSPTGDWVTLTTTVAHAEALLGGKARFHQYRHASRTDMTITRLDASYLVPAHVDALVDFVGPTIRFPLVVKRPKAYAAARSAAARARRRLLFGPFGANVNPTTLRKLYNATDAVAAPGTKNIQACASFLGQFYSPSDLVKFFSKYASSAKVTTPTVHGPNEASNPGVEAELDIQYIMGVGRDIPTQFWSTAGKQPGSPENEPFLVWLQTVANMTDDTMPHTISVSYGDNEPSVHIDYATRVNTEFQKAGVRGTSIMFSSGDGGVAGGQSQQCTTFIPTYPAGSIWVTAVGGTTKTKPEVCAKFSSGGFSNYWPRPSYQDAAVKGYLSSGTPGMPASVLYNTTGAGIPDVAAQGENFAVIQGGSTMPVDGTSCSSPAFTAIVGLLNEARMAAGKTSLGYLNQLIYKKLGPAGAFNDVTKGSNPGCDTQGFPAAKGWDPVTGWGTPDFGKIRDMVLALP